jgi:hypothetical protein
MTGASPQVRDKKNGALAAIPQRSTRPVTGCSWHRSDPEGPYPHCDTTYEFSGRISLSLISSGHRQPGSPVTAKTSCTAVSKRKSATNRPAVRTNGPSPGSRSLVRVEHGSPVARTDRPTGRVVRGARNDRSRGRDFDRRHWTARDRQGSTPAPWCFSSDRAPMADDAALTRYQQCDEFARNPSMVRG